MSIAVKLPVDSRPIITSNSFDADFGVPTINRYDFGKAANLNVQIIPLQRNTVYLIERANFTVDIAEQDYKEALVTVPNITLKTQKNPVPIFPSPQPFLNYINNLELHRFFHTGKDQDFLTADFAGVLSQPPGLVGDAEVIAWVQFNIYEVTDISWLKRFYWDKDKTLGQVHGGAL